MFYKSAKKIRNLWSKEKGNYEGNDSTNIESQCRINKYEEEASGNSLHSLNTG